MVKERDKDSDPRAGTLELSELDPPFLSLGRGEAMHRGEAELG